MRFEKYSSINAFEHDNYEILMENEVQNNLPLSFLKRDEADTSGWIMAAVKGDNGAVVLSAICTLPFNIVMCETRNMPNNKAVQLLADELNRLDIKLPGILAEKNLAGRFATAYAGENGFIRRLTMNIMQLDNLETTAISKGKMRLLCEDDMFFVPYWEREFGRDCKLDYYDISKHAAIVENRIAAGTHYIWEDSFPVSQAAHGRSTANSAIVSSVYTPPHFRGKGYASSVVSQLSQKLLEDGYKFCCLFADAENPVSCKIYRRIGYKEISAFDDIKFV